MSKPKSNLSNVSIADKSKEYSDWYLDVAKYGDLYSYSPVPGCINFKPKAIAIWNNIRAEMVELLSAIGVQDVNLPLLIPESYLKKEKQHVKGFKPECYTITHMRSKKLNQRSKLGKLSDPLIVRPTSETLFCEYFKSELKDYTELPMLYNQWVNVMRKEKKTRPFLRTAEFLWQEGHTLHETKDDANEFALSIQRAVYMPTINERLAIAGILGEKSPSERFAGAERTYTFEGMMSNGRALQMATAHLLGEGFVKQFDIKFKNRDKQLSYPYYTSWGVSTRLIGGLISSHSDQKGLVIPPKLSEFKAVVLPVYNGKNQASVDEYVAKVGKIICGERANQVPYKGQQFKSFVNNGTKVLVDYRPERMGRKINDFELSGYPVRIMVGQQEMENQECTLVSRITGEKICVKLEYLKNVLDKMLEDGQQYLFDQSQKRLQENTIPCQTIEEIGEVVGKRSSENKSKYTSEDVVETSKFALFEWAVDCDGNLDPDLEPALKEKFKATTRCIPFEGQFTDDLLTLKDPRNKKVIIARNF